MAVVLSIPEAKEENNVNNASEEFEIKHKDKAGALCYEFLKNNFMNYFI